MTVVVNVGRRVPRNWFKRKIRKLKGFMSFQENIWIMIKQALQMAKKKANKSGKLKFVITYDEEIENLNYKIEWVKCMIQGTKEQEEEEYNEAMQLYKPLGKILKKDVPINKEMKKRFKSNVLSKAKVDEAYKKGYGAVSNKNVANKILEMGIITHIEWIKDFDSRDEVYI